MTDYEAAVENLLLCLSLSDGILTEMDYDVNAAVKESSAAP